MASDPEARREAIKGFLIVLVLAVLALAVTWAALAFAGMQPDDS